MHPDSELPAYTLIDILYYLALLTGFLRRLFLADTFFLYPPPTEPATTKQEKKDPHCHRDPKGEKMSKSLSPFVRSSFRPHLFFRQKGEIEKKVYILFSFCFLSLSLLFGPLAFGSIFGTAIPSRKTTV